ncbi:hypothetical protein D9M72_574330 [compost metagenome]
MVEEHFLGERRALAQRKQLEHLIFLAGEVDTLSADFHRLGIEIDDQLAGGNDRLGMTLGTAHDRMDACHQLVLVERLGHVVVGAEAETANLVFNSGHAGENEDRRLHLGKTQCSQDLVTGHVRKVEVEKDDVVVIEFAEIDAFFTEIGGVNVETLGLQHQLNALSRCAVVFD